MLKIIHVPYQNGNPVDRLIPTFNYNHHEFLLFPLNEFFANNELIMATY